MSFHFIRPEWLLALIPMFFLLWKLLYQQTKQGSWDAIIDPDFRNILLLDQAKKKPFPWSITGLLFIWLMSIIALSGPTWQEVKAPAEKKLQGSVIVLDLSLSMLAEDIKPSRITRAQHKIRDLLKAHPEHAMGMVGYSGSAHTIAPISQDNQTLLTLAPTLTPAMMPSFGSNVVAAMHQAQQLLEGAKINKGHIIWITDDLEKSQIEPLTDFFNHSSISLSILTVGTTKGSPIPIPEHGLLKNDQGEILLAKLPYERLNTFANRVNATLVPLGLSDKDIKALLPKRLQSSTDKDDKEIGEQSLTQWLDKGIYLLFGIVLLASLAFRRGWLLSFTLAFILPVTLIHPSPAFAQESELNFSDIFTTPDKQGYLLWQKNDYVRAEIRFEDPAWRGSALYRLGKFDQAAQQFSLDKTARGYYNLANALARLGKFEEAKKAYEQALKKQPEHTKAQVNLQLTEDILKSLKKKEQEKDNKKAQQSKDKKESQETEKKPEEDSKQESDPSQDSPQPNRQSEQQSQPNQPVDKNLSEQHKEGKQEKYKQRQANQDSKDKQSSLTSDTDEIHDKNQAVNETAGKLDDKKTSDDNLSSDRQDKIAKQTKKQTEQQQAKQTWLKQIPDEPGLFLQRKFEYQYQTQPQQKQTTDKIW